MGIIGYLCASLIDVLDFGEKIPLGVIFVFVIIFALARRFLRYGKQSCNRYISFKLLSIIQDHVFKALLRLCPVKLECREKGDIMVVITPDIEQAKIVRRIYGLFLQGNSAYRIAQILTSEGIPTPAGKTEWSKSTVRSILKNEKYKGDALLQKSFIPDFLTKKQKKNSGEIPQYYVEGNHEVRRHRN